MDEFDFNEGSDEEGNKASLILSSSLSQKCFEEGGGVMANSSGDGSKEIIRSSASSKSSGSSVPTSAIASSTASSIPSSELASISSSQLSQPVYQRRKFTTKSQRRKQHATEGISSTRSSPSREVHFSQDSSKNSSTSNRRKTGKKTLLLSKPQIKTKVDPDGLFATAERSAYQPTATSIFNLDEEAHHDDENEESSDDERDKKKYTESQESTISVLSLPDIEEEGHDDDRTHKAPFSSLFGFSSTPASPTSKPKRKRQKKASQAAFLLDFMDDDVPTAKASPSRSMKARRDMDMAPSPNRFVNRRQHGENQMIHDDCTFLCSSLLASSRNEKTTVRLLSELAVLLSSNENRKQLYGSKLQTREGEETLGAILDAVSSCVGHEKNRVPIEVLEEEEASTIASSCSRMVLDAASSVMYFLSLDCTLTEHTDSTTARRIRHQVLSHACTVPSLLFLVIADNQVAALRGWSLAPTITAVKRMGASSQSLQTTTPRIPRSFGSKEDKRQHLRTSTSNLDIEIEIVDEADNDETFPTTGSVVSSALSATSGISTDPTRSGRMKRKKRRKADTIEGVNGATVSANDEFGFPSSASINDIQSAGSGKTRDKLERTMALISSSMAKTIPEDCPPHKCKLMKENDDDDEAATLAAIPLIALCRVVSGKVEWGDQSCMDDVELNDKQDNDHTEGAGDDSNNDSNPLFVTNRLLGNSGSIPLMAQALAETQAAVVSVLRKTGNFDEPCPACLAFLHNRLSKLTALVDEACLLNDSNRKCFCEEGYTAEAGGYLIVGLAAVLHATLQANKLFRSDEEVWSEIALETLRSLTSLTHENSTAVRELESELTLGGAKSSSELNGISLIAQVLFNAVSCSDTFFETKLRYDCIIFCLNSLTNCVESSHATVQRLACTAVKGDSKDKRKTVEFMAWMTDWLVGETSSFRDAVQDKRFGSSDSQHVMRPLEKHEEDGLVTAGNGFVLLACLLIDGASHTASAISDAPHPRVVVLKHLPGYTLDEKVAFIKNTLKAFCNFYRYSVGDLSVAVIKPVQSLIAQLEATT